MKDFSEILLPSLVVKVIIRGKRDANGSARGFEQIWHAERTVKCAKLSHSRANYVLPHSCCVELYKKRMNPLEGIRDWSHPNWRDILTGNCVRTGTKRKVAVVRFL